MTFARAAHADDLDVRASSEITSYADSDHVYVVTPTIAGGVSDPVAGWNVDGRYLLDMVSAASVDIVSTASRRWEENRHVGALDASYKPSTLGASLSTNVSSEPDYLSLTAGGALTKDFDDKLATALVGFSFGHDTIGKTGTPFSVFSRPLDRGDVKLGFTRVINASTTLSLVLDGIVESGDSSKPYRFVPMFAAGVDVPKGASPALVTSLRSTARPLEQLPTNRQRYVGALKLAHRFQRSTIRADERMYADSWSLKATTTDARFLYDVSQRVTVGPHLRFHAQTPVSFWQRAYVAGPGLEVPALRTGDRELGPMVTATAGGTLRWQIGRQDAPEEWVLGFDLNGMWSRYLDSLYLTQRVSLIAGVSIGAQL